MNKAMSMIRVLLVGIGCIVLIAMWCIVKTQEANVVYIQALNYIPSPRQIQQSLKDLDDPRYDPGKVDGIPGPDTITAWNNLIKDRYAKRAFEGE
jgi:hypothetical protein